ncbi:DnaJ-domain-containing protein [Coprinopsis marcescibilis]|uniref:DnaJ-domain-containing protein n=1 Tax=Coprinopsis marcescibilis TaxID=230819 RepID=A0A5C3LBK2_COPMA|nr:DnaJ-domain-containing protein [Coprinopsis marcescibilis]
MLLQQKIQNAYVALGLQQGCTLEVVKTTYRQAALRTHPDKNPENPEATAEFQKIGDAYRVLLQHLGEPIRKERAYSFDSDDEYYDHSDDGYGYGFDDDDDDELAFSFWLFEMVMGGQLPFFFGGVPRGKGQSRGPSYGRSPFMPPQEYREGPPQEFQERPPQETQREFQERLEKSRQEQIDAQVRRDRDARNLQNRKAKEREEERLAAEQRQKQKQEAKKSRAEAEKKKAEDIARTMAQKAQRLRSEAFEAARAGDAVKVKHSVWELSVDASGGEIKVGAETFVTKRAEDPKQTLLHIAATNGDLDLVQWLSTHGGDMEERNSEGLTVLHLALKNGQITIAQYIFDEYPPDDAPATFDSPASKSSLMLAIQSGEPELVWMVLNNGLATSEQINEAWARATSNGNPEISMDRESKEADIIRLLMRYGGFTPPPAPCNKSETSKTLHASEGRQENQGSRHNRNRQPPSKQQSHANAKVNMNTKQPSGHPNQGKLNRGRGRGKVGGRGRGFASSPSHR